MTCYVARMLGDLLPGLDTSNQHAISSIQWLTFLLYRSYTFMANVVKKYNLSERDVDRIVEMAWEDRTSFDAIKEQFGVPESDVIALMRQQMRPSSWRMWRARVQGRRTKHQLKQVFDEGRFKSTRQRSISYNKISKR